MLRLIVRKKAKILGLGGAFVLLGIAVLLFYLEEIMAFDLEAFKELIVGYGPLPFFGVMFVALFFGSPVTPFLVLAGIYGLEVAITGCLFAITLNVMLTWFVSGRWLRPFFERLVERFGYKIPHFRKRDMIQAGVLIRLTPGLPFVLQNYLLGLARMPFKWYLIVSLPIVYIMDVSVILFGDALLRGDVGVIVVAVFLILMISFLVRVVHNRLKTKDLESQLG